MTLDRLDLTKKSAPSRKRAGHLSLRNNNGRKLLLGTLVPQIIVQCNIIGHAHREKQVEPSGTDGGRTRVCCFHLRSRSNELPKLINQLDLYIDNKTRTLRYANVSTRRGIGGIAAQCACPRQSGEKVVTSLVHSGANVGTVVASAKERSGCFWIAVRRFVLTCSRRDADLPNLNELPAMRVAASTAKQ